jgi:hypothetical protein
MEDVDGGIFDFGSPLPGGDDEALLFEDGKAFAEAMDADSEVAAEFIVAGESVALAKVAVEDKLSQLTGKTGGAGFYSASFFFYHAMIF